MADIRDYLELRSDILLRERPFNDVDNVILATLSYLDFTGIVPGPGKGALTVAEACDAFLARADGQDICPWVRSLATIDVRFVEALGSSARLGAAGLRDYVDVVDDARTLQFSALCCDLSDTETYVSFRGTDNSLIGWKEDFMLSFCVTAAQESAAAYLEREARLAAEQGRSLYVGGHSKGGVLAAYAAAALPEGLRRAVLRVWSNDGPGMAAEAVPALPHEVYGDRYVHIVPAYDVVGMVFDTGSEKLVVRSSAEGAMQHDPMSWQVSFDGMVEAPGLEPDCVRMNKALTGWLSGIEAGERQRFTDELFEVLQAGGAERLDEVLASPQSIQKVLGALGAADQRTKDLVWELLGAAVGANVESARDAARSAATQAVAGIAGAIVDLRDRES